MSEIHSSHDPVTVSTNPSTGWAGFLRQFQQDAKLWIFCLFMLAAARAALIVSFRGNVQPSSGWHEIAAVFLNGARFDSALAVWFVLPSLVISIACGFHNWGLIAHRVRMVTGIFFAALTPLLFVITREYFREFNDQFNYFMFNAVYDDTKAIFKTVLSDYHPVSGLATAAVAALLAVLALKTWMRPNWLLPIPRDMLRRTPRIITIILIALALIAAARGSAGRRPVQKKDAAVTADEFLNKCVVNAYTSLRYAIQDHLELSHGNGLRMFLPDENIARALQLTTSYDGSLATTVDDCMKRAAQGPSGTVPDHVFVIVMESYEAWPLFEEFECLGIAPELNRLEKQGVSVRGFLPASSGTMESFATIITGLPDAGIHTNYQATARKAYPTSVAAIFKNLGYRTRMFYGGYLSWQSIADFSQAQGFDEVYGGGHMGSWASGNEWGVDDENLFTFVEKTVQGSPKSFNLILSTSFHPPYDINVGKKGFVTPEIPAAIAAKCGQPPVMKMLGHFWYADHFLGEFVHRTEAKLPHPLYLVTGDHSGRRAITQRPTIAERALVPCVLYGPDVLPTSTPATGMTGSHMDIGPTLVELAAPRGTVYHALGGNMLAKRNTPLGTGRGYVVGPDFLWCVLSMDHPPSPLPDVPENAAPPKMMDLRAYHDAMHGIAWWRISHGGTEIPHTP